MKIYRFQWLCFAVLLCLSGLLGAQTAPYGFLPNPRIVFVDSNGAPLSGGFLYSYAAGTGAQLATYHLDTLSNITPNQNPIILDATGSAEVRLLPQAYKFVLQDFNHAQIWQIDQVSDVGQLLYTQAVLLNPSGGSLQTIAGPLAMTTLSLNGGTPLTTSNQSGTGNLCLVTNCGLVTPSINAVAIPNSPGTYVQLPNAITPGTTLNTLTKFASAPPAWIKRNDQTGSGSGSPQTATAFSTSLTNPSLIVVYASGPIGTFTISDTAGNTYSDCGPGQIVFNASVKGVQCFYALNTHTTASNIVSFASTGGGAMKLTAMEWTGAAISAVIDVTQNSGGNQSSGTGGGQNVISGNIGTTAADLVVGFAGVTAGALTVGPGYTASSSTSLEYLTQSGPTSAAATWNDGTNNDSYAALIVAFRPASSSISTAVIASISDLAIQGIAVAGTGTTGNVVIQQSGGSQCLFDGPTNANDYVTISSTVGGDCHDAGLAAPTAAGSIGTVTATSATAATEPIILSGPNSSGSSSGAKILCSGATGGASSNTTSIVTVQTCAFPAGALNLPGKTFRLTFTMNNVINGTASLTTSYFGMNTSPSFPAGIAYGLASTSSTSAPQLINTPVITCVVNTAGVSGNVLCSITETSSANAGTVSSTPWTGSGFNVNLTGVVYVGNACSFSIAGSLGVCTSSPFILEQLN